MGGGKRLIVGHRADPALSEAPRRALRKEDTRIALALAAYPPRSEAHVANHPDPEGLWRRYPDRNTWLGPLQ